MIANINEHLIYHYHRLATKKDLKNQKYLRVLHNWNFLISKFIIKRQNQCFALFIIGNTNFKRSKCNSMPKSINSKQIIYHVHITSSTPTYIIRYRTDMLRNVIIIRFLEIWSFNIKYVWLSRINLIRTINTVWLLLNCSSVLFYLGK